MSVRSLLMSLAVFMCGAVCYGQAAPPPQPFGGAGGGQQPAAPAPQPFGGGAGAGQQPAAPAPQGFGAPNQAGAPEQPAASADAVKDKAFLDGMMQKKVLIKVQLKGKLASLWVGESFGDLSDEDKQALVRMVYKRMVAKDDPKFKSPMSIYVSDGQRQGPRVGLYTVNTKGDKVVFAPPRPVGLPFGAGFVPDNGFGGQQEPLDDGSGNGVFCPCQ